METERVSSIDSLVSVKIPENERDYSRFKYIVLDINGKKIIRGEEVEFHKDIKRRFMTELASELASKLRVEGGGRIAISKKEKKITAYGSSASYGGPNLDTVKSILEPYVKDKYPDFTLEVSK